MVESSANAAVLDVLSISSVTYPILCLAMYNHKLAGSVLFACKVCVHVLASPGFGEKRVGWEQSLGTAQTSLLCCILIKHAWAVPRDCPSQCSRRGSEQTHVQHSTTSQ